MLRGGIEIFHTTLFPTCAQPPALSTSSTRVVTGQKDAYINTLLSPKVHNLHCDLLGVVHSVDLDTNPHIMNI